MTREILTPHGPFSFIALVKPKIAIGGISAYGEKLHTRFGFILSVAKEFYEKVPLTIHPRGGGSYTVHYAKLDDTTAPVDYQLHEIERAVALVKNARDAGHTVLVTCAQGRNRSALVAAEAHSIWCSR